MIHLIWLGEQTDFVRERISHFRQMNPDDEVRVWTDIDVSVELMSDYARAYEVYAKTRQAKSDLLRFSLLERYGGWYFDIDTYLLVSASSMLPYLDGPYFTYSLLHLSNLPNPDVLYCPAGWDGWDAVHEYIVNYQADDFRILAFAAHLLFRLANTIPDKVRVMNNPELFPDRPRYYSERSLVLRGGLESRVQLLAPDPFSRFVSG